MKLLLVTLLCFTQNQNVIGKNLLEFWKVKLQGLGQYLKEKLVDPVESFIKKSIEDLKSISKDDVKNTDYLIDTETEKANKDTTYRRDYTNSKPDKMLTTPQDDSLQGRNMESHTVETNDGYILTIHRIISYPYVPFSKGAVILHHGLLGSSADWILLGMNSLPYILSHAGYDVWLTNARGNYYSRGHMNMTLDDSEYWNFSWQEMGLYDLPAVIEYIRRVRNSNETINFIGHSMGATALLVLLSTTAHFNQFLRLGILLAPLAFMNNVQGPMNEMISLSDEMIEMLRVGDGEFLPSRKIPSWLASKYCSGSQLFCTNPLFYFTGIPMDNEWSPRFVAKLLHHVPAGGSTDTILHYLQLVKTGKFHKFNDPFSEFDLKHVTLPMILISSTDDRIATTSNVLQLYFSLTNPVDHYVISGRNMTHTDFVWGTKTNEFVFNRIKEYLETGLSLNAVNMNEV